MPKCSLSINKNFTFELLKKVFSTCRITKIFITYGKKFYADFFDKTLSAIATLKKLWFPCTFHHNPSIFWLLCFPRSTYPKGFAVFPDVSPCRTFFVPVQSGVVKVFCPAIKNPMKTSTGGGGGDGKTDFIRRPSVHLSPGLSPQLCGKRPLPSELCTSIWTSVTHHELSVWKWKIQPFIRRQ